MAKRNVYIDTPAGEQVNPGTLILVGEGASAEVRCAGADNTQHLLALHGASLSFRAEQYAVVDYASDGTAKISISKDQTAILL